MWKNPIFIYTYIRPFSHWNSDESNSHGHTLYSPLLRGRFPGLPYNIQAYHASQIMGALSPVSSTNLFHTSPYDRHRQLMGLHHSPSFHLARLTALTTEVLRQFPTKDTNTYYSYVNDIYLKIMQYENSTKSAHTQWNNVIMNYGNSTKRCRKQCNIGTTHKHVTRKYSGRSHPRTTQQRVQHHHGLHLQWRAIPFDRGPKCHDTACGEIPLEKIIQQSTGVHLQRRTLPYDRGPHGSRSVHGERN